MKNDFPLENKAVPLNSKLSIVSPDFLAYDDSMSHYRAVILSPHLDDAVFSCGGTIARLRKEGKILILNIFTRYLHDASNAAVLLSDARYAEETAAAQTLDYAYKNLGELDAFFRLPKYRFIANIFKPLDSDDMAYLPQLKNILEEELSALSFDQLYVPLAVGWHADHHLTFLAMVNSKYREKILFYEDAPYCLISNATAARVDNILGQKIGFTALIKRWWSMSVSFNHSGMVQTIQPAWQRIAAFPVISIYLWQLLKRHARTRTTPVRIDPIPETTNMSAEAAIKMKAANCYASQVKKFFCDAQDMRASYQRHASSLGHPNSFIERCWKMRY